MEISGALDQQLAELLVALGNPSHDLLTVLTALARNVSTAVPSFFGLTICTPTLAGDVILSTLTDASPAAQASMLIPLDPSAGAGGTMVLFATTAGAFLDLGADAEFVRGGTDGVLVDRNLDPATAASGGGAVSVVELSQINQAIGVLVDRGQPPDQAWDELRSKAGAAGRSLLQEAVQLLGPLP